jgi:hypothetical protein
MGCLLASGDRDKIEDHHALLRKMLQGCWHHVRHLIISSYGMKSMIDRCRVFCPKVPLPAITDVWVNNLQQRQTRIFWPDDARNLTTITIHDMNRRKAEEREKLLQILRFYFPKLADVRCSYTGDNPCMRRYRITNDGQLKWWYSGQPFKTLPEELTADEWFGLFATHNVSEERNKATGLRRYISRIVKAVMQLHSRHDGQYLEQRSGDHSIQSGQISQHRLVYIGFSSSVSDSIISFVNLAFVPTQECA